VIFDKNLPENQIRGLTVIISILTVIPFIIFFSDSFFNYKFPILINRNDKSLTVGIEEKDKLAGSGKEIYFVPRGTTVNQLLPVAGIKAKAKKDFPLENGMRLIVDTASSEMVFHSEMENYRRLALGMPVDLNGVTEEDLILIPGIGEKTAGKIILFRNKKGFYKSIEELADIEGIKEKKLAGLRKYLYVKKAARLSAE
jgi:hypothetical protein